MLISLAATWMEKLEMFALNLTILLA